MSNKVCYTCEDSVDKLTKKMFTSTHHTVPKWFKTIGNYSLLPPPINRDCRFNLYNKQTSEIKEILQPSNLLQRTLCDRPMKHTSVTGAAEVPRRSRTWRMYSRQPDSLRLLWEHSDSKNDAPSRQDVEDPSTGAGSCLRGKLETRCRWCRRRRFLSQ